MNAKILTPILLAMLFIFPVYGDQSNSVATNDVATEIHQKACPENDPLGLREGNENCSTSAIDGGDSNDPLGIRNKHDTYISCLNDSFKGSHHFSASDVRSLCEEIGGTQEPTYNWIWLGKKK